MLLYEGVLFYFFLADLIFRGHYFAPLVWEDVFLFYLSIPPSETFPFSLRSHTNRCCAFLRLFTRHPAMEPTTPSLVSPSCHTIFLLSIILNRGSFESYPGSRDR